MSIDDELEEHEAATVLAESINPYVGQRCCVTMDGDNFTDVIHGRFLAIVKEWPAIMVRDLTPGVELLQRKRLISVEVIRDVCFSPKQEKCRNCPNYKDLLEANKEEEDEGEEESGDGSS